jgi:hypothetical protein
MKSLRESLFDKNLAEDDITSLYALFGGHIKKFKDSRDGGWTHYFAQGAVKKKWVLDGSPTFNKNFSKTTFPPDLQKFIAIILKNTIVIPSTLKDHQKLANDSELDTTALNDILEEAGIIWPEGTKWGNTPVRSKIEVYISYIDNSLDPETLRHKDIKVGNKNWKGLDTDKIEISIVARSDVNKYINGIWTLLTDLSIKDI